jgi:phosphatidylserine decarboxylase
LFFRDPDREGPRGDDLVIAPADGRVIDVRRIDEPSFLGGPALRISIFLSLLDVHVNRYPVSGTVRHRSYQRGRFQPAWRHDASLSNERAATGIDVGGRPVLVVQVAGLAARRVVTYARLGEPVAQGDRMGLIRFGSRVDVYLSERAAPRVQVGQRAVGGVTVLAELPAGREASR